ncbi:MAG: L-seryl-tRNA(Sec) selenium transferase [Pseudomonadales bacterium]
MSQLRHLPSIDRLLAAPAMAPVIAGFGAASVKDTLRRLQADCRDQGEPPPWSGEADGWAEAVTRALRPGAYRTVFNLTGTIIHTNLGRALPPAEAFDAVRDLVTRPMNLEFDLDSGRRGDRETPVARRLCLLTGAEAATVVNNNAAALMLVLNTLARERNVPVSRGDLIEIGGSFRLPELMERSGCRLLEVGTTNRTHAADFAATADRNPALLLKVHPSNFHVSGFSKTVSTTELGGLSRDLGVPLCVDLGSGTLVDLRRWGLPHEPTPAEVLAQGADLVTFSGDKLLGGIQSGLIVGRRDLVEACKRNPIKRALRADKITLALLDRVLALYEAPDELAARLPLLRTLTLNAGELTRRAHAVCNALRPRLPGWTLEVVDSDAQIGSGSLPNQALPSVAVHATHPQPSRAADLQAALRALPTPVIARLQRDAVWLDMRGAEPEAELLGELAGLTLPA